MNATFVDILIKQIVEEKIKADFVIESVKKTLPIDNSGMLDFEDGYYINVTKAGLNTQTANVFFHTDYGVFYFNTDDVDAYENYQNFYLTGQVLFQKMQNVNVHLEFIRIRGKYKRNESDIDQTEYQFTLPERISDFNFQIKQIFK